MMEEAVDELVDAQPVATLREDTLMRTRLVLEVDRTRISVLLTAVTGTFVAPLRVGTLTVTSTAVMGIAQAP